MVKGRHIVRIIVVCVVESNRVVGTVSMDGHCLLKRFAVKEELKSSRA